MSKVMQIKTKLEVSNISSNRESSLGNRILLKQSKELRSMSPKEYIPKSIRIEKPTKYYKHFAKKDLALKKHHVINLVDNYKSLNSQNNEKNNFEINSNKGKLCTKNTPVSTDKMGSVSTCIPFAQGKSNRIIQEIKKELITKQNKREIKKKSVRNYAKYYDNKSKEIKTSKKLEKHNSKSDSFEKNKLKGNSTGFC